MALKSCRVCGTAYPAHSACPKCAVQPAPAPAASAPPPVAYQPPPPRPPEPSRPWWRTVGGWGTLAGWLVVVGGCVLIGIQVVHWSRGIERESTEKAEVERETGHLRTVLDWVSNPTASTRSPVPADRPVPTSDWGKRLWVINRMLVDRAAWEREVLDRHGARGDNPPEAWQSPGYLANARAHADVARYVEGRVAAIAEIEKTSGAWLDSTVAALARESGLSVEEVRGILPADFGVGAVDGARRADALLQLHRHLVRVDPRVHQVAATELRYERAEDATRTDELVVKHNEALAQMEQARRRRTAAELAAINRWLR